MTYRVLVEVIDKKYTLFCNEVHQVRAFVGFYLLSLFLLQDRTSMAEIFWIFYVSKVFDYCDTLIIIIRRKWRQLSFLHVYHHITIFLVWSDN